MIMGKCWIESYAIVFYGDRETGICFKLYQHLRGPGVLYNIVQGFFYAKQDVTADFSAYICFRYMTSR